MAPMDKKNFISTNNNDDVDDDHNNNNNKTASNLEYKFIRNQGNTQFVQGNHLISRVDLFLVPSRSILKIDGN